MREDAHDTRMRAAAAELDRRLPGWLIMYSPFRRMLTAIAMCTPTQEIHDAPDPRTLLVLIEDIQRTAYLAARAAGQPTGAA